jgi:hypothetical protein
MCDIFYAILICTLVLDSLLPYIADRDVCVRVVPFIIDDLV